GECHSVAVADRVRLRHEPELRTAGATLRTGLRTACRLARDRGGCHTPGARRPDPQAAGRITAAAPPPGADRGHSGRHECLAAMLRNATARSRTDASTPQPGVAADIPRTASGPCTRSH